MPKPAKQIVLEMEGELLNRAMLELPQAIALDVVQNTIAAAFEAIENGNLQDWDDETRVKNYILGIYNHKRDDALRFACRNRSVVDSGSQIVDPGRTLSSVVALNERSARVNHALGKLDERERNIIIWKLMEDLTYSEIGGKLGISYEAVRKAFLKAGEKFKKYYGPDTGPA